VSLENPQPLKRYILGGELCLGKLHEKMPGGHDRCTFKVYRFETPPVPNVPAAVAELNKHLLDTYGRVPPKTIDKMEEIPTCPTSPPS
jgi:hypothetical protein